MNSTIRFVAGLFLCSLFSCANAQDPRLDAILRLEKAGIPRADAVKRIDSILADIGTEKDPELPVKAAPVQTTGNTFTVATSFEELEAQLVYLKSTILEMPEFYKTNDEEYQRLGVEELKKGLYEYTERYVAFWLGFEKYNESLLDELSSDVRKAKYPRLDYYLPWGIRWFGWSPGTDWWGAGHLRSIFKGMTGKEQDAFAAEVIPKLYGIIEYLPTDCKRLAWGQDGGSPTAPYDRYDLRDLGNDY